MTYLALRLAIPVEGTIDVLDANDYDATGLLASSLKKLVSTAAPLPPTQPIKGVVATWPASLPAFNQPMVEIVSTLRREPRPTGALAGLTIPAAQLRAMCANAAWAAFANGLQAYTEAVAYARSDEPGLWWRVECLARFHALRLYPLLPAGDTRTVIVGLAPTDARNLRRALAR